MTDHNMPGISRRRLLQQSLAIAGASLLPASAWPEAQPAVRTRAIPSSGEVMPIVGLGTWITFNVGNDATLLNESAAVMAAFFEADGRMIDSSPMYGSSQDTLGFGLDKLGASTPVFSADKVWTSNASNGANQIETSEQRWGVPRFDLLQVHNLVAWEPHLSLLRHMKAADEVRYIGITTSESRRHTEFENVMRGQPIDFIQVSYNILNRDIEDRILPLAMDKGIAVIANRPFQQKRLIHQLEDKPLPLWASDFEASSWAQFLLKYVISHPAITCAIPATTRVDHVRENMACAAGPLPDANQRERMAAYVRSL
ncbi:MAG: aldo/keto reductase [Pseudohongiellaceae bacterium]